MIYGVTGMWGANKLGIIKYRIKNGNDIRVKR